MKSINKQSIIYWKIGAIWYKAKIRSTLVFIEAMERAYIERGYENVFAIICDNDY